MTNNPYKDLPDRAFWKRAVASRHYEDLESLWEPPAVVGTEKFATAGSCFAQHIGRQIAQRGKANYMDLEPAPLFLPASEHEDFGYGIYTCRYGNIYTTRQLLQISEEALGKRQVSRHVWRKADRFYDAVRPSVDPTGHKDAKTVYDLRKSHLSKVAHMLRTLDVFVFTLGLTEAWTDPRDGTVFATAPGVIAGNINENEAVYKNLTIDEVRHDLHEFWSLLREVNPRARMILTVSPVPLIATASGKHVMTATTYSKSVLRVAAEELSIYDKNISYFPSYEIINSAAGRGHYFRPDLRSVHPNGVEYVMSHFFTGDMAKAFPDSGDQHEQADYVVCDEEQIETVT